MKLFRLYGWERSGQRRIEDVRRTELKYLWQYSLQWAWVTFLIQASTVFLTLLTIYLYPYFQSTPEEASIPAPEYVLSGLALINQFTVPLCLIPVIVPDLIAARNSTHRLQKFFRMAEVKMDADNTSRKARTNSIP